MKDSRVRGVKDSIDMLKNYKELKVWQASYKTCLHIYKVTKQFPNLTIWPVLMLGALAASSQSARGSFISRFLNAES